MTKSGLYVSIGGAAMNPEEKPHVLLVMTDDEWLALYESNGDKVYQGLLKNIKKRNSHRAVVNEKPKPWVEAYQIGIDEGYKHGKNAAEEQVKNIVIKELKGAIEWGEKFGDDHIPGLLKARISHIQREGVVDDKKVE